MFIVFVGNCLSFQIPAQNLTGLLCSVQCYYVPICFILAFKLTFKTQTACDYQLPLWLYSFHGKLRLSHIYILDSCPCYSTLILRCVYICDSYFCSMTVYMSPYGLSIWSFISAYNEQYRCVVTLVFHASFAHFTFTSGIILFQPIRIWLIITASSQTK